MFFDRVLERGNALVGDAEALEEIDEKGFGLGVFI